MSSAAQAVIFHPKNSLQQVVIYQHGRIRKEPRRYSSQWGLAPLMPFTKPLTPVVEAKEESEQEIAAIQMFVR